MALVNGKWNSCIAIDKPSAIMNKGRKQRVLSPLILLWKKVVQVFANMFPCCFL